MSAAAKRLSQSFFGRFSETSVGHYPQKTSGLYHGAEPWKVRKLIKPKYNQWHIFHRKPALAVKGYHSKALGTLLRFTCSHQAIHRINALGHCIDAYLMCEDPRLINNKRAFLYKEQIRQVYAWEREERLRRRDRRVQEIVKERAAAKAEAATSATLTAAVAEEDEAGHRPEPEDETERRRGDAEEDKTPEEGL